MGKRIHRTGKTAENRLERCFREMKVQQDHLTKKEIMVYTVIAVLLVLAGIIMFRMESNVLLKKEQEDDRMKLDAVCEVVRYAESAREVSRASFEKHLQQHIRFMAATLSADMAEGGYQGRKLFSDGAVVQIRDGKVIWPEGMPVGFPEISEADIREGRRVNTEIPVLTADGEAPAGRLMIQAGKIADDWYYVDWTDESELLEDQYAFLRDEAFLKIAEESFGGTLLLVSSEDSSLPLLYQSKGSPDVRSAAELGFTPEIIAEQRAEVNVKGERSLCTYATIDGSAATLIYVQPVSIVQHRAILHVSMTMTVALILLVTMNHYIFAVRRYIRKNRLSAPMLKRYRPKSFRRIIIMAGLTGAVVVFLLTSVFQTMDALHVRSVNGAKSMNRLFEYLQETVMSRAAYDLDQEADWYVYTGERLADVIARHPENGSGEKLQEYCDMLGIDFIMLFDSNGEETASNADYSGFTMDDGLGENSSDFRRLLRGIPSVVHDVSTDKTTGLTRQMIGVTMPLASASGKTKHGALVMALVPEQLVLETANISRQLRSLSREDSLCLFTDKETGKILYTGDENLRGKTVFEIGLTEKGNQDGFTDFATIRGKSCYVTLVSQKSVNFCFISDSASLFSNTLPAAALAVAAYLLPLIFSCLISMRGYDAEPFRKMDQALPEDAEKEEKRSRNYSELLISRGKYENKWEDSTPEKQANFILRLDVLLMVLLPALFFLSIRDDSFGGGSLLRFILYGDWMRGLNMFSVCGVVIVITLGFLILVLCNGLLSMIAGFCGRGGETICRLLYSLCRYVVALTILYYVFEYIGLSLSTYFASLGMVSLAISLGSRDMVADIVAGIMILFERQFQVGDTVDLDGCNGVVLEMGIRSTKLLTADNNIRFISNSGIRSVVNRSRSLSVFRGEYALVTDEPLEKLEERFRNVLAQIGKKNPNISGDLKLAGISRVSGGGNDRGKVVVIRVKCECREKYTDSVRDFVNREVFLYCEQENIEIRG